MKTNDYTFQKAIPVWEKGTARHMNRTVCFVATVPATEQRVILSAAASCAFVLTVNGVFVAHGPARTCHGYFRVDEYDLSKYLTKEINTVALRVASYNVNAFSYLNQPGFLCAEISMGGEIVAATGHKGFVAYPVTERVQRVHLMSCCSRSMLLLEIMCLSTKIATERTASMETTRRGMVLSPIMWRLKKMK